KIEIMARSKEQALNAIAAAGVVAVIRAPSKEMLPAIAEALLAGGVPAIEVTMTTPGAIAGIEMLVSKFGERAIVGVGTVLDVATARDAISVGAEFVVSPVLDSAIIEETKKRGKISIPGAFSPTEIL